MLLVHWFRFSTGFEQSWDDLNYNVGYEAFLPSLTKRIGFMSG